MRWLFLLLILPFAAVAQNNFPALGMWREHLPYQHATAVAITEKKIVAATPYSLFTIDRLTKEIERISKVSGLHETGISTIEYDPISKKLFIAYNNSNIDVLSAGKIINIPDLMRSNISGDKTIYHIYTDNNIVYLSTGIAVVVLNAQKNEIKESWFIGANGGFVKINALTKHNNFFYAATEEGLKKASAATNLLDFRNWENMAGKIGLSASPSRSVVLLDNKIVALQNDSLFVETPSGWKPFFANGWPIQFINTSENKIFVSQRTPSGAAQMVILKSDGTVERTISQPGFISFPKKGISDNGTYWIADLFGGLSHWQGNSFESYRLNSPADITTGGMAVHNNVLYATAGSVNNSWNYQYNRSGIFKFENGTWTNTNQYNTPGLDTLLDFITVAVDPRDGSAWVGSFGGGLLHLQGNSFKIFKQNSPIGPTVGDPLSYRVAGLAFDQQNNLWVSNFGATKQLHVLKNNGTWQSFTAPFFLKENAAADIVMDDFGNKWIISPLGNGVIVFNEGNIDNPNDDKWKLYKAGAGTGNLPSNEVLSIAKDKNGFIWVGSTDGVAVIQCTPEVFQNPCDAVLPVIREGGFINYLFKGQEVRSIAVDGANRKWIATSSGAWLMAPDGDKVISHFTEDNSPLLSSDVKKITINGATGEVFFATAKGLSSFRGTATEAEETRNNVIVFPNPVPPNFSGTIGIRGLPENSFVKITELNGRLVFQTRTLGGQAVWNGKDYKGNKAATGIYLVIAVDEMKQEKIVSKIVFVR